MKKPTFAILGLLTVLSAARPARADAASDAKAIADARATLTDWLDAQNDGSFEDYLALYAPAFVGTRRTAGGKVKTLDLAGWQTERKKMFKYMQLVAADGLEFDGGLDLVAVVFTQRWWAGSYADHGTKSLTMRRNATGAMKIVKEELLSSKPGWDDAGKLLDATALISPITVRVTDNVETRVGGNCASNTVTLTGADGVKLSAEINDGVNGTQDEIPQRVDPLNQNGVLFEFGNPCWPTETFELRRSGDTLVVITSDAKTPWSTYVTLKLPPKAKVKARR